MKKYLFAVLAGLMAVGAGAQQKDPKVSVSGWTPVKVTLPAPVVVWQNPVQERQSIEKPTLVVRVCVQGADLQQSHFVLNGRPVGSAQRGFKKVTCGDEFSTELALVPGLNEVRFQATNAGGTTTSESRYITYNAPVVASGPVVQKRYALIVSNANYSKYPLKNPVNDGRAVREQLEKLGFVVTLTENQSHKELRKTVDAYVANLTDRSVSLFFYAGHGLMVEGNNYLQPVDATPASESDVRYDCYPLRQIIDRMEDANKNGSNLVFWDACRNNPYRSWTRGGTDQIYATTNPPVGTLIIYATEPGKPAQDGDQENGLFTSELIRHLNTPNQDIVELINRIDMGLEKRGFHQPPYMEGRLRGKFMFNPSGQ